MTRTEIWLTEMMCHFKSIDDMRRYYEHLVSLPNCNTCKRKDCEHKPKFGEDVRFNCFAYTDEEPKDEPNSSENPNNCEDLQDWKDRMWAEAVIEPQTDCAWR